MLFPKERPGGLAVPSRLVVFVRLASEALTLLIHRIASRHYVLRDCRSDNRIHLHGRFDFAQYCLLIQPANSTQADMHLVPGIAAGLRIGAPGNREHHLTGDLLIIHCLVSGRGRHNRGHILIRTGQKISLRNSGWVIARTKINVCMLL
jgi:hypothetical protein